jgi:hypothetical protein
MQSLAGLWARDVRIDFVPRQANAGARLNGHPPRSEYILG